MHAVSLTLGPDFAAVSRSHRGTCATRRPLTLLLTIGSLLLPGVVPCG